MVRRLGAWRIVLCCGCALAWPAVAAPPTDLWIDGHRGADGNAGSAQRPLKTLSAAIALLPDPLEESVTIHLAAGTYATTGGQRIPPTRLDLMRRMRPGVTVRIVGDRSGPPPVLAWETDTALVDVREGDWWLEHLQLGTFTTRQRQGVLVTGPAHATLGDLTLRLRSHSDAGIVARAGGEVSLRGRILLNEHLHDAAEPESFCGIRAEDHGIVRFREREGALLDLGNGSLSASYYGVIRLGCETARITNWSAQSNLLAINNSGRIDLHNTTVTLDARDRRNTPIGLEHDGHILAEGAHVRIVSDNSMAIALQKVSSLTCNDLELCGKYEYAVWAASGSLFLGGFKGDLGRVEATTGAAIVVESVAGRLVGPVAATHAGRVALPDRDVLPEPRQASPSPP